MNSQDAKSYLQLVKSNSLLKNCNAFNLYSLKYFTSNNWLKSSRIISLILKFVTDKLKNQGQGKVFKADSVPLGTRSTSSSSFFSIKMWLGQGCDNLIFSCLILWPYSTDLLNKTRQKTLIFHHGDTLRT